MAPDTTTPAAATPAPASMPIASAPLQLSELVITPTDLNRLQRELDAVDAFLLEAKIREPGTNVRLPRSAPLLDDFVTINQLNLLLEADRQRAQAYVKLLKVKAPVVHISFAADPSAAFMNKLVAWFRHNIHPQLLVRIGLQPTIAAGCVVRTANKSFDFSLRQRFIDSRELLIEALRAGA